MAGGAGRQGAGDSDNLEAVRGVGAAVCGASGEVGAGAWRGFGEVGSDAMDRDIPLAVRYEVLDEFLRLLRFEDWKPDGAAYACMDPEAPILPLESIRPPDLGPTTRGLADERVLNVLRAIREGAPLPPVPVF